ncbi:hypothetical protein [Rhodococcus jostii]|uniref:Transposase n=1 Tax=Rhodococcus jostii TaxID=132919 RepID=A0ABU4CPC8_RHOJO|nr:hypothetical protein [Rhodococcus jostii]MDV6285055.1 hypothetical protein [Rhodococcus jostii]
MLLLATHAVIALAGMLAPNRSAAFIRHLARQIALARIQQRWIAMSGTDVFDTSHCPESTHAHASDHP